MSRTKKARRIINEAISTLQVSSVENDLDFNKTISDLKYLHTLVREMNPGTVILTYSDSSEVLYHPRSVELFEIDSYLGAVDKTIVWKSICVIRENPEYQTRVGIMRDTSVEDGWVTVVGWGKFEKEDDYTMNLTDLPGQEVYVQALPLASYDLGVRLVTKRLSEIAAGKEPQPERDELIYSPELDN